MPSATHAAEPLLEPPAVRSRFHGFRVGSTRAGTRLGGAIPLPTLFLPRKMAPAACRLRMHAAAGRSGAKSCSMVDPTVVWVPGYVNASLTANGMPCSGGNGSPARRRRSASAASARAASSSTVRKACTIGSSCSMRARQASTASAADTVPSRSAVASCVADHVASGPASSPTARQTLAARRAGRTSVASRSMAASNSLNCSRRSNTK